jgi:uncharacterized protein
MITDPVFYAVALPAVLLMGLSKGGFAGLGLLALPLMTLAVSPIQAAAIMLPILLVQDVVSVWSYRHSWDSRNLTILLPAASFGIVLGYLLAAYVSEAAVILAVGAVSVAFALRHLMRAAYGLKPKPKPADIGRGMFWGTLTGFTSMVAHAGGPPFQIYVLPQRLTRDVFVGTGAILFALINWIKVPPYLALGQFTGENLSTSAALFPAAVAATFLGVRLVRRVDGERFFLIVHGLLVMVGCKLVWDGWRALL